MKIRLSFASFAALATLAVLGVSMNAQASPKTQIKPYGPCESAFQYCVASGRNVAECEELYQECLDQ